jgi:hypothetical protein
MTQDPLYTEDYTKLPQKIPLSPTLSLLSLSLSLFPLPLYPSLSTRVNAGYIFLSTLSPLINVSPSFSPLPGLVSPLRPWFLCTWREAHRPPLTLPSWSLARVVLAVPSAPSLTSLLTVGSPSHPLLVTLYRPLDLCTRLSPRPPSIKVGQRPLSLSLWLSCVEIRPIKLIITKTTVSACKRLQREGGGWWPCPSVVGRALIVPSLLADLIFSNSGKS